MIFNWKNKLLGYENVKIGGVKFLIRKLTPAMFLENPALLPFSNVQGDIDIPKDAEEAGDTIEKYKIQVREIILKGVISPEIDSGPERKLNRLHIDEIMETQALYNELFSAIFLHSFNALKKKSLRSFKSKEKLRAIFSQ